MVKVALIALSRGTFSGGYAKYLREVVPHLRARPEIDELRVYVPSALGGIDPSYRIWTATEFRPIVQWLRQELTAWRPDVIFIPGSLHFDFDGIPVVTMVRNMEPLERPFAGNRLSVGLRNVARAAVARYAAHRSACVIAVSEHVRNFIVRKWRLDPAKVAVIPHGVTNPGAGTRPATMQGIEPRQFLFTAGSIRPARGLEDVIEAAERGAFDDTPVVAIAGSPTPDSMKYAEELRRRARRVVWLGQLSPDEMAWCFESARLFVMTSRAEACPNTVLEAMAHGCLCVSTDQPPMPEFFAESAIYYRGGDSAGLARVVHEALALDPAVEARLRHAGLQRSRLFTWEATAAATAAALAAVARSA